MFLGECRAVNLLCELRRARTLTAKMWKSALSVASAEAGEGNSPCVGYSAIRVLLCRETK